MPWRLVGFFFVFLVFLVFILSNLENKCDISFINPQWILKDVPVFITVFGSFLLGMLCSIPLIIAARFKKNKKPAAPVQEAQPSRAEIDGDA
ncbi:MAG: hypothetical protein LBD13_04620 [Spirochaetaceae bacterium]|jgi:uncharacterized integral membrane protein|nr:hypothetical protein [Spirochaetaceae bacterium]